MAVRLCAVFRRLWPEYRILHAQRTFPGISFFVSGLSRRFWRKPGVFARLLDLVFSCSASHSYRWVLKQHKVPLDLRSAETHRDDDLIVGCHSADFVITKAIDHMVIHQADSLHEGVADRGTDEVEAAFQ